MAETTKELNKTGESGLSLPEMYKGMADIGTEEMGADDVNMSTLKLIQSNTRDIKNKNDGWYYRSDTQEQVEMPMVNLVYVTTKESMNYNQTGMETQKLYFGFFDGSNEPFKMYVRGYGLRSHREFQSQVKILKARYGIPMFALKVQLLGEELRVTIKETGKTNDIYVPKFNIIRNGTTQMPIVVDDEKRAAFLLEAAERFRKVAILSGGEESDNDQKANNTPVEDDAPPFTDDDLPFGN